MYMLYGQSSPYSSTAFRILRFDHNAGKIEITRALINARCWGKGLLSNAFIQMIHLDIDYMINAGLKVGLRKEHSEVQRQNWKKINCTCCSVVPRLSLSTALLLMNWAIETDMSEVWICHYYYIRDVFCTVLLLSEWKKLLYLRLGTEDWSH